MVSNTILPINFQMELIVNLNHSALQLDMFLLVYYSFERYMITLSKVTTIRHLTMVIVGA